MKHIQKNQLSILLTAALLGLLIVIQSRAFQDFGDVFSRNSRADVFREIQILKQTNDNLDDEIAGLEDQLEKLSDNQQALEAVREEVQNLEVVTGRATVSGPGISLRVNGDVRAIWLTDIVNELFSGGAEAVSVNGIRLTDKTVGFDTIPSGQILLNSVILKSPYAFVAIGDKRTLESALKQPQGILERLSQSVGGVGLVLEAHDLVTIEKVL